LLALAKIQVISCNEAVICSQFSQQKPSEFFKLRISSEMENDNNIGKEDQQDIETPKIPYRLRSGQLRMFNITRKSCEPFGFYFGERVKVRGGKKAWVVGVLLLIIV
jgi:hypothetical protein